MTANITHGAIALVGSGEYTAAMNETDMALLATVGGVQAARVVVLPTAAGLEGPESTGRWTQMGLTHFTALGAAVEAVPILARGDTANPIFLAQLEAANFFYFSGGNPQHVVETFTDTPAWEIIRRKHGAGAVYAGCSAGAMAAGGHLASFRALRGGQTEWMAGLGIVPHIVTLPHFDRMPGFIGGAVLARLTQTAPAGTIVVGVDEDTALVERDGQWQVMGRQTVTVFRPNDSKAVYSAGQTVLLSH